MCLCLCLSCTRPSFIDCAIRTVPVSFSFLEVQKTINYYYKFKLIFVKNSYKRT